MSTNYQLNSQQKQQLVEQYVNISVDRMSTKDLELYVIDDLYHNLIDKDEIDLKNWIEDDELFDELVDNVLNETVLDINNTGGKF